MPGGVAGNNQGTTIFEPDSHTFPYFVTRDERCQQEVWVGSGHFNEQLTSGLCE